MVVRDDDNASILLMCDFSKQFHDLFGAVAIESSSRFIGENHGWIVGQCPCNGNSLLFPSRQPGWFVVGSFQNTKFIESLSCPTTSLEAACVVEFHRNLYVFNRRQKRNQIGFLKNKPHIL